MKCLLMCGNEEIHSVENIDIVDKIIYNPRFLINTM